MRRIACFLAIGLFVVSAWNHAAAAAEVTIRLVRDITASEVFQPGVELDELELAESPVIAGRDIVTFDWQTRTLEIRRECWAVMESLLKVDSRRLSGLAKPFVLLVGNERLYAGMFYDPASSVGIYGGHLGVMICNIDVKGPFVRLRLNGVDENDGSDRAHKLKAAFSSAGILLGQ